MISTLESPVEDDNLILCGKFGKTVGLKGAIRFFPSSGQLDTIASLDRIFLGRDKFLNVQSVQLRPDFLVLSFDGLVAQEQVSFLVNKEGFLNKSELPKLDPDRYYWFELIGLNVLHTDQRLLGTVEKIYSNGPQDILLTSQKQHIPFVFDSIVKEVSLSKGYILVDFDSFLYRDQ